jgi:hypothetical protein
MKHLWPIPLPASGKSIGRHGELARYGSYRGAHPAVKQALPPWHPLPRLARVRVGCVAAGGPQIKKEEGSGRERGNLKEGI